MSEGEFEVQGYTFNLFSKWFSLARKADNLTLRIGVDPRTYPDYNMDDFGDLKITVRSELNATVEANGVSISILYNEYPPPIGRMGMIYQRIITGGLPVIVTILSEVPREVIFTAVAILNGDDYAEQYRVRRNNAGRVVENNNNNNNPTPSNENVPVLGRRNNENNPPAKAEGGRRRRRKTRKGGRR